MIIRFSICDLYRNIIVYVLYLKVTNVKCYVGVVFSLYALNAVPDFIVHFHIYAEHFIVRLINIFI